MSKEISGVTNKEPLMHISKRDGIETWKSWLIRMIDRIGRVDIQTAHRICYHKYTGI